MFRVYKETKEMFCWSGENTLKQREESLNTITGTVFATDQGICTQLGASHRPIFDLSATALTVACFGVSTACLELDGSNC